MKSFEWNIIILLCLIVWNVPCSLVVEYLCQIIKNKIKLAAILVAIFNWQLQSHYWTLNYCLYQYKLVDIKPYLKRPMFLCHFGNPMVSYCSLSVFCVSGNASLGQSYGILRKCGCLISLRRKKNHLFPVSRPTLKIAPILNFFIALLDLFSRNILSAAKKPSFMHWELSDQQSKQ